MVMLRAVRSKVVRAIRNRGPRPRFVFLNISIQDESCSREERVTHQRRIAANLPRSQLVFP